MSNYTLSMVHEKDFSVFHRNYFIVSLDDIELAEDSKHFEDTDMFLINQFKENFQGATKNTLASVLITIVRVVKPTYPQDILIVFNDENKEESLDLFNGLLSVVDPESLDTSASGEWVEIFKEEFRAIQ